MPNDPDLAPWDRALGYALTGTDRPDWAATIRPDGERLVRLLAGEGVGLPDLLAHRDDCRARQRPWPHPVPDALRAGIGAAHWAAVLADVLRRFELDRSSAPVLSGRSPDADERRLLRDVPPHHGV